MAIQDRTRRDGTTSYRVYFNFKGRRINEPWGTDRREAERLDRRRKRELAAGTYAPAPAKSPRAPVAEFAATWLDGRRVKSKNDERTHLEKHVLTREWFASKVMDDVEPNDVTELVKELHALGTLSPKYVANIYGTLRTMFKHARHAGIVQRDPCVLLKGTLQRGQKKARVAYERAAVRALIGPKVEPDQRMFAALAFFLGPREGEVCGLKFSDYDPEADTLGAMTIERQYGGESGDDETKTKAARKAPVHPILAALLDWWWDEGFEYVYCRKPTLDDHIVPMRRHARSRYPVRAHHTRSSAYKMWRRACKLAGVENKTLHATRHTMITWARRGGARKEIVEKITHNASGDILDHYTHFDWYPLCEAILCLTYEGEDRTIGERRGPIGRRGRALPGGAVDPEPPQAPALLPSPEADEAGEPRVPRDVPRVHADSENEADPGWRRRESNSGAKRSLRGVLRANAADLDPPGSSENHERTRGRREKCRVEHGWGRLVEYAVAALRIQAEGGPDAERRLTELFDLQHREGTDRLAETLDTDEAAS